MSVTLHTVFGNLKLEIFCDRCPKAAENFLALCASGYYDNCLIHRNIKGFIVQTGDPTGTGKGGTSIWKQHFADELREDLKHDARAQPSLDLKYTVFGKVIDGFDTLFQLENVPVDAKHRPTSDIRINCVTIHANPIAENAEQF
uniref:Peptidyl-prolyl cis-trans isomerase n=1 Tax=Trichuris muris TaxID=70415 RepID=A0A5S6R0R2_TRIMR